MRNILSRDSSFICLRLANIKEHIIGTTLPYHRVLDSNFHPYSIPPRLSGVVWKFQRINTFHFQRTSTMQTPLLKFAVLWQNAENGKVVCIGVQIYKGCWLLSWRAGAMVLPLRVRYYIFDVCFKVYLFEHVLVSQKTWSSYCIISQQEREWTYIYCATNYITYSPSSFYLGPENRRSCI